MCSLSLSRRNIRLWQWDSAMPNDADAGCNQAKKGQSLDHPPASRLFFSFRPVALGLRPIPLAALLGSRRASWISQRICSSCAPISSILTSCSSWSSQLISSHFSIIHCGRSRLCNQPHAGEQHVRPSLVGCLASPKLRPMSTISGGSLAYFTWRRNCEYLRAPIQVDADDAAPMGSLAVSCGSASCRAQIERCSNSLRISKLGRVALPTRGTPRLIAPSNRRWM
jgi:hypothetical protein